MGAEAAVLGDWKQGWAPWQVRLSGRLVVAMMATLET